MKGPTPERILKARGLIEDVEVVVNKSTGRKQKTGAVQVIHPLNDLLNRGLITEEEYKAGEIFEKNYQVSRMEGFRVSTWSEFVDRGFISAKDHLGRTGAQLTARRNHAKALEFLGNGLSRVAFCVLIEDPRDGEDMGIWEWVGRNFCGRKTARVAASSGIDLFRTVLRQLDEHYN